MGRAPRQRNWIKGWLAPLSKTCRTAAWEAFVSWQREITNRLPAKPLQKPSIPTTTECWSASSSTATIPGPCRNSISGRLISRHCADTHCLQISEFDNKVTWKRGTKSSPVTSTPPLNHLGQFWKADLGHFSQAPKTRVTAILNDDLEHVSTDLLIRILASLGYQVKVSVVQRPGPLRDRPCAQSEAIGRDADLWRVIQNSRWGYTGRNK